MTFLMQYGLGPAEWWHVAGLAGVLGGLAIRWHCQRVLGKFFT